MVKSENTETKIAKILVEKGIVSFSFDPPYVYTTGLKSPIYIDNRMLISFPREREYIVKEMVNLIKGKKELKSIDYISSTLSFAAPFGVLIAQAMSLPLVLVREERRTHGKRNKIEGYLPAGSKVLVVEDHISTGAALIDNVNAIRENKSNVSYAVAITDYEIGIARKALAKNKINTFVLTKGLTMVDEAVKHGLLKEKEEILEWFEDPIKWGKERGYYDNVN